MKRNAWAESVPIYFALRKQQRMTTVPLRIECDDWNGLTEEQREAIRALLRPLTRQSYQKAWNQLHPRSLTPAQRLQAKIRRVLRCD